MFGGNFLILDVHIHPISASSPLDSLQEPVSTSVHEVSKHINNNLECPSISYVDIGFGSNERNFSGVHRFEIARHPVMQQGKEQEVKITFSSMSCNPSSNKPPFPKVIFWFHCWYAMCLFRDGVKRVIRG